MKRSKEAWERIPLSYQLSVDEKHYFDHLAKKRPKYNIYGRNRGLDIETKRVVLKASSSIVSLVSYSGDKDLAQCSGIIIESNQEDNTFIVMTSAFLVRSPAESRDFAKNNLADDLKVVLYASDNTSYKGELCAFDFHYNLVTLKFNPNTSLPVAKLWAFDDSLSIRSTEESSFQLRPHSVKLEAGDPVIAVGRYFAKPFNIMAAPGYFSIDRCDHECRELYMALCKISECGDGGALINLSGEVMGITFNNDAPSTPFLPIKIAMKWWEHYKIYRETRHPYLGFEATNLFAADVDLLERVYRAFPSVSKGILVEQVLPGSSAHSAGLQQNDIIVMCDGNPAESFLELFNLMWNKVDGSVELEVLRVDCNTSLTMNIRVVETAPENFYRWRQWPCVALKFPDYQCSDCG